LLLSARNAYRRFRASIRGSDNREVSRAFLRAKNLKRNLSGKKFNFVTIDQATQWTSEWVEQFPRQYDLVVGVPRSGMLVATIVALKLGKGLTTPDLLKSGEYWHSNRAGRKLSLDEIKHIIVIDDSVDKGRAMGKAMAMIDSVDADFSVTKAALIVKEETKHNADLYYKIIEAPRTFEWNILHRKISSYASDGVLAVDLDGVLCPNPPKGADDDEEWYVEWLKSANPFLIPGFEIDVIITCRLEKYRAITEAWLEEQNVRYKKLIMWDVPTKADRQGRFAKHKIDSLLTVKPDMFWESNRQQSEAIWKKTRIPTLCIDDMTMFN
jgi:orotate phosphoribosyltransferase